MPKVLCVWELNHPFRLHTRLLFWPIGPWHGPMGPYRNKNRTTTSRQSTEQNNNKSRVNNALLSFLGSAAAFLLGVGGYPIAILCDTGNRPTVARSRTQRKDFFGKGSQFEFWLKRVRDGWDTGGEISQLFFVFFFFSLPLLLLSFINCYGYKTATQHCRKAVEGCRKYTYTFIKIYIYILYK